MAANIGVNIASNDAGAIINVEVMRNNWGGRCLKATCRTIAEALGRAAEMAAELDPDQSGQLLPIVRAAKLKPQNTGAPTGAPIVNVPPGMSTAAAVEAERTRPKPADQVQRTPRRAKRHAAPVHA